MVLLCVTTPPVPINGTDPSVSPVIARLVVVAFVALRSVIVPEATDRSVIVALLIVVVAKVEVPVTVKVLVTVALVEVKLSMIPFTALKKIAKRFVEVADVDDALVVKKLVEVAFIARSKTAKRFVEVAEVEEALVVKKLVEVLFPVINLSIVADAT